MRILFVTKFLPMPADSGGKQRSLAVLRRLTALGEVTVCAIDDGTAERGELARIGVRVRSAPRPSFVDRAWGMARHRSITASRFASRRLLREIRAEAKQPVDVLVVSYGQLAPYAQDIAARHKVLDLHNVESALMSSYAASSGRLRSSVARAEAMALRRIERKALAAYDVVSVVSDADRARLARSGSRVLVCPNGWEPAEPMPMGADRIVAFVALMGWAPNVDAARWLSTEVWPHVRTDLPDARLHLVGREPTAEVMALAADDITVTGTVPEIAPYLRSARVAVAPLRAGGGSRLKILEALDAGRPVVATTIGAEGLEALIGVGIVVADDPGHFADEVVALLRDPARAAAVGAAGNAAVREQFSWDRTLAPLLEEIRRGGSPAMSG